MYKQKKIQFFSVRKGRKKRGLVTGTGRGKEKVFVTMRVFSPHHQLMIFPDNQYSKYYMLLCLEDDTIGRSPFLFGSLYCVYVQCAVINTRNFCQLMG